jgi:hypothetical protein
LLAGVEDDIVAEEYALTTRGMAGVREAIWEHLMRQPLFVKGDEEAVRGVENMLSSRFVDSREMANVAGTDLRATEWRRCSRQSQ